MPRERRGGRGQWARIRLPDAPWTRIEKGEATGGHGVTARGPLARPGTGTGPRRARRRPVQCGLSPAPCGSRAAVGLPRTAAAVGRTRARPMAAAAPGQRPERRPDPHEAPAPAPGTAAPTTRPQRGAAPVRGRPHPLPAGAKTGPYGLSTVRIALVREVAERPAATPARLWRESRRPTPACSDHPEQAVSAEERFARLGEADGVRGEQAGAARRLGHPR